MTRTYQDKYQELKFVYDKLEKYKTEAHMGFPISTAFNNFFRINYEFIDWLKRDKQLQGKGFGGKNGKIESFISDNIELQIAIEIRNKETHCKLSNRDRRTNLTYGNSNVGTNVNFTSFGGSSSTDCLIEINGKKRSMHKIAEQCMERWENFFYIHDL